MPLWKWICLKVYHKVSYIQIYFRVLPPPKKKKIISPPPLFVGKLVVKVHVEKGHPTYTIFIEEQVQNYITYTTCGISIHTCIHMTCQATSPCSSFFYPQLWNKWSVVRTINPKIIVFQVGGLLQLTMVYP